MGRKWERARSRDFREFVFTATGKDTNVGNLSKADLFDNLDMELDRLQALGDLIGSANDTVEVDTLLQGLSLLLRDIERRMRAILDVASSKGGRE